MHGQDIGAEPKPLRTLIDTLEADYGGGRDDDVPLAYFVGLADYSVGSWRWFGPFTNVDVLIEVNTETLKSRFKSPNNRFYLTVLAVNEGSAKAVSANSKEGFIAEFPVERSSPSLFRRVFQAEEDPGGVTVEAVVTDIAIGIDTEPAIVTGLLVSEDTSGVTISWDNNPDPDTFLYQVLRADPDTEDSPTLLAGITAPTVTYKDASGTPGKTYRYGVRARNDVGFGGMSYILGTRQLAVPSVSASDGTYEDLILIQWSTVEGAQGYRLYRAESETGGLSLWWSYPPRSQPMRIRSRSLVNQCGTSCRQLARTLIVHSASPQRE